MSDTAALRESVWLTLSNGEQLHIRRLSPPAQCAPRGTALLLHGEGECGRVFYDESGRGLAWHLLAQGFHVFIPDMPGRGKSLTPSGEPSTLALHAWVSEALPAVIQELNHSAEDLSQVWIGHGLGGLLLNALRARLASEMEATRAPDRLVMLGTRRRMVSSHWAVRALRRIMLSEALGHLVNRRRRLPLQGLGLGSADESIVWWREYRDWVAGESWVDPVDGFDYLAALHSLESVPTLFVSAAGDRVYANVDDVKAHIKELDIPSARYTLLSLKERASTRGRRWLAPALHTHLSMLLHEDAVVDCFEPVSQWLLDADPAANRMSETVASANSGAPSAPLLNACA